MDDQSDDGSARSSLDTEGSLEKQFANGLKFEEVSKDQDFFIGQKELDALYSRDMYKLSLKERDSVLHDIHGISDAIEENPKFVEESRRKLKEELALLANTKPCMAYQQAQKIDPSYTSSELLEVTFLRSERWDPKQTAEKLVMFLEAKLDLFGPELLTKKIRMSDLSKEDKKSLESGFFQLLPVRDVAGRAVITGVPMLRKYQDLRNLVRSFVYIAMVALEDEETQKNGVVMIGLNTGKDRVMNREAAWAVHKMARVLPMRVVGIHFCYDALMLLPMVSLAMLVMGATRRVRFRAHYGTAEQIHYKLLTFGIPQGALPITEEGEPKVKTHRQWVKSRQQQEENGSLQNIIVIPGRLDVLFGRGKPIQEHYGNLRYHALLDHFQPAYEKAKKFEKMNIAQETVDQVHAYAGRFLKPEAAGWIVVDDTVARDKVSHAFRTRRSSALNSAT